MSGSDINTTFSLDVASKREKETGEYYFFDWVILK